MIFRPSGGVLYHWRAWRRRAHWQPFVNDLEKWLTQWNAAHLTKSVQKNSELILIGPSAGYTLPHPWLKRFSKITAYDLDPLAPLLFRRVHPGVTVMFKRKDAFWKDGRLSIEPLQKLLTAHPHAAILFSNVLGQLLLEGTADETQWLKFLGTLREALNGRAWASYHDLYTHEDGEVIDHLLSGDWKQGLPTSEFRWPLTARSLHILEGVHSL